MNPGGTHQFSVDLARDLKEYLDAVGVNPCSSIPLKNLGKGAPDQFYDSEYMRDTGVC